MGSQWLDPPLGHSWPTPEPNWANLNLPWHFETWQEKHSSWRSWELRLKAPRTTHVLVFPQFWIFSFFFNSISIHNHSNLHTFGLTSQNLFFLLATKTIVNNTKYYTISYFQKIFEAAYKKSIGIMRPKLLKESKRQKSINLTEANNYCTLFHILNVHHPQETYTWSPAFSFPSLFK